MDQIPPGVGSGSFDASILLGLAFTRLSDLRKKVHYSHAQRVLDEIHRECKDIERQIKLLGDFLKRAEFSPDRHHQCKYHIYDLQINANKLINTIGSIEMRLTHGNFFRRSKHRLSLVDSDFGVVRRLIDKINGTITTIRQEMILEILIDNRNEHRVQNREVREDIQRVNRNLIGTDAKQIRKIYRVMAIELMHQYTNFGPVDPATSQPPANQQPSAPENPSQAAAPAGVPEGLPPRATSRTQTNFDLPTFPAADLDFTEAFTRILGGSTLNRSGYTRISHIVELPA
ncbi:hypothetical protein TWF506_004921 [Arthrobotrys conoides]|uniref:Fungal N-terminal domain-containing protein n=1 Tax=Arthrobotrys conoides TaxID=74498 RepID=A0AAN8RZE4_9PEZI